MSNSIPFPKYWVALLGLLTALIWTGGCASKNEKTLDRLDKTLRIYNNAFESKSESGGSAYVLNDYRMDYLLKYNDIQSRVSFFDVQVLNHAYFKEGKALEINEENPDGEFDEAIITMRYKIAISPSNRLKTIIHEQRWKLEGVAWRLEPNLKPFLN